MRFELSECGSLLPLSFPRACSRDGISTQARVALPQSEWTSARKLERVSDRHASKLAG